MSINDINRLDNLANDYETSKHLKTAESSSVHAFNNAMQDDNNPSSDLESLIAQITELLQKLMAAITGQSPSSEQSAANPQGGSIPTSGNAVSPVTGSGAGGSAGSDLIPKPTEHLQTLNLGGKNVVVGGDGTASAAEVQATAQSIQNLYANSPTFKNMIDNSSDPDFDVSVGRRSDNTSWGNTEGRLFMNINNINPGNSDSFQSLLGHEFAHASIDLGHGSQMEQIESAIAREA
ncbi:MAG: Unknown protein [uncultured Thiotrichaceae bacterium]|uniref:Uncharacterized protein n=1 Tax=uncultured Thiotrichaceae bacterium TaxID=298394 RepID=A0A6S6TVU8_9GAMM|nr:MAG: Unknown protein [uncultured Thiotrichaceae bacterium]